MLFPATYGEVMGPLDVTLLPKDLRGLYDCDPVFREWVHLTDQVGRAEKISCWTQWTPEQTAAYKANDMALFSQLRGYTESEIEQFTRSMQLSRDLDAKHGDGFCLEVDFVLSQLVHTEALRAINQELRRMSEAGLRSGTWIW